MCLTNGESFLSFFVSSRVYERVQHEDGHGLVDLARNGSPTKGHQTQQTDREPAEIITHGHGQESSGDFQRVEEGVVRGDAGQYPPQS